MRSKRIRVMYVVPDLGVGGAERHVTKLMPNLDRSHFDTAVVCIGTEGKLFGELAGSGVRAVALHRTKRQAIRALRDLMREMRNFAPDVVITRGYNAEMLGRIAAWLTHVPHSVVWVHNHGDTEPRGAVRRIADRVLDRVTSAYFGVARAQIDYMVNDLKYSPDKIHIIHNGVDPDDFQWTDERSAASDLGICESDKVVGIFAALRPEKDHANFLRAARLVADRIPQTKFLIVGDGPMRPEIERLVHELDLADSVVLTGARMDVPELLRAIDVFVLSSYTVECFPMALLEAMAAGRPAVCTAVGGVPEMIEEPTTGYLVPPRNPDALADRLVCILSDSELAHQMGKAARVRVETLFSLRESVSATERALESSGVDGPKARSACEVDRRARCHLRRRRGSSVAQLVQTLRPASRGAAAGVLARSRPARRRFPGGRLRCRGSRPVRQIRHADPAPTYPFLSHHTHRCRPGDTSSPCCAGTRAYRCAVGPGAGEPRCGTRHGPDIGR